MFELFDSMNNIIWEELKNGNSINSFRRELQNHHINLMIKIYSDKKFPVDAQNLSLKSLQNIYDTISKQDIQNIYDNYTQLHLLNMKSKIEIGLNFNKINK